jgi:probable HAF family extracellular repeat protein
MTRSQFFMATLACSLATSSIAAHAESRYRLTQIVPDTPASTILAADLNDRGQVVGFVQDSSGRDHAFAWRDGTLTNLGPLFDAASPSTRATANNDRGDILGVFFDTTSDKFVIALLPRRGEVTRIEGLPGETEDAGVADINNRGQIAAASFFEDGSTQAFIWEDGNVMPLPALAGDTSSLAVALNEHGEVLGTSRGPTGHVVIWKDAQPRDLNIPAGTPRDINDREQVVGTLQRRGFLWERGTLMSLPVFDGAVITQAASINNAGEIVGESDLETSARATLWEDGQIFNLNDLVVSNDPQRSFVNLQSASQINDRGAIVAIGRDSRFPSELRTYLLTPVH